MIEEKNEKIKFYIKICLLIITYIIIGLCGLFFILIQRVDAAQTLNTWNGSTQGESCSNCTDLSFGNQRGISTTNYFYTNQGTNVNWTFAHTIRIYKNVNSSGVMNLQSPTIRLYDGNSGYYDLTANNHCQGVYWRMNQSTQTLLDIKTYEVSFSCDISNFKSSFPSVSLLQVIYSIDTTANIGGRITEDSFITTETPYTTQNDYTGTINSVGGNIINNQNQNTTTITNNDNHNTDRIIENQNQNSQATIDAIENQNKKCTNYDGKTIEEKGKGYFDISGNIIYASTYSYSDYISVIKGKTYSFGSSKIGANVPQYDKDKNYISTLTRTTGNPNTITATEDGYIRVAWYENYSPKITGEYCYNLIEKQNETSENIESALTDSSVNDPTSSLNGLNANIGTNSVISDLLLLPVTLFQSVLNSINGTCSPFNLGTLYGHSLSMPCLNISGVLGNVIYGVIDVLISGFFILSIRKKFVDIFNSFTSLKVGGNELE